jgi:lysophospholipase L1-like esterase
MRRVAVGVLAIASLVVAPPLAAQTVKYIAFGDSITFGFGDAPRPDGRAGYPPRLEAILRQAGQATAVVENDGFSGERTPEGLTRLDGVLAGGGNVLLLMEGTNDISRAISLETTVANLDAMAKKAEARGMTATHATLIPRRPDAKYDPENIQNQRTAQSIRDLAGNARRKLVDPFELMAPLADLFTKYYYPGSDDPVGHPNSAGYDLLAQYWGDVLLNVDKVPPVAGILSPDNRATNVSPEAIVTLDVWDFGAGTDLGNTTLLIDGLPVAATQVVDSRKLKLVWDSSQPLQGSVRVGLRTRDLASPPNTADRDLGRFLVAGATLLSGDLDQNGRVDGTDLVSFALHFGARRGERRFDAASDLNGDGVIDGLDLAVLANNFGRSSF